MAELDNKSCWRRKRRIEGECHLYGVKTTHVVCGRAPVQRQWSHCDNHSQPPGAQANGTVREEPMVFMGCQQPTANTEDTRKRSDSTTSREKGKNMKTADQTPKGRHAHPADAVIGPSLAD